MADENEQRGGPIRKAATELLPAGRLIYQMTIDGKKSTRAAGWCLTILVTLVFVYMLYCSGLKLFAKSPSARATAIIALKNDVSVFDKALTYAGDHFDPQLDAYDLSQKWGPQIDAYADKLVGNGASKEQLDKLIRHPPSSANDPKMGEYYKKVAAELDKMAGSLVIQAGFDFAPLSPGDFALICFLPDRK
jgi:hypothetical protein